MRQANLMLTTFGSRRAGFTLLEMLVSTAILSAVMLMLFSILQQSSEAWNGAEKRIDSFREARAALFMISRDLEAAVPIDGKSTFFLNKAGTPPVGAIGSPSDADHGDNLFFVVSLPATYQDSGNKSDLCLVGYYLSWDPVPGKSNGERAMNLRRYFRSSDAAYTALKGYYDGTTTTLFTPNTIAANADEVVARNVTNFFVTPYIRGTTTPPLKAATTAEKAAWDPETLPAAMGIQITALNYSVANTLTTKANWEIPPDWETTADNSWSFADLIRRNARTFQTRINLSR